MPEIEPHNDYKYLGILEAINIMHTEMKDMIQNEDYRAVRQLITSKLNGEITIKVINSTPGRYP